MLKHLNADEGVERFLEFRGNLAVVEKVDAYFALKSGFPDALFCQFFLLNG